VDITNKYSGSFIAGGKNCVFHFFNAIRCISPPNTGHTHNCFGCFSTCSHDCGFHMLMHAQHWGRAFSVQLQEKDICNIRKILTHTWLNFEENDTVGKHAEFGIGSTTVDSNQVRQQWILHQHAYPDSHIHRKVI